MEHNDTQRKASHKQQKLKRIQAKENVINFARNEARQSGIEYGGPHHNLTRTSVKINITEDRETAIQFAKDAADPDEFSHEPRIVLFSDGSVIGKKEIGGAGVTFKHLPSDSLQWTDFHIAIGGTYDCFEVEVAAIGSALQLAFSETESHRQHSQEVANNIGPVPKIYIFTDSQDSLMYLRKYLCDPELRQTTIYLHPSFVGLLQNLDLLVKHGVEVEFHWVKGHEGVEGNHRADVLAKRAVNWFKEHPWLKDPQRPYVVFSLPTPAMQVVQTAVESSLKHLGKNSRKRKIDDLDLQTGNPATSSPAGKRRRMKQARSVRRKAQKELGSLGITNATTPHTESEVKNTSSNSIQGDLVLERDECMSDQKMLEDDPDKSSEVSNSDGKWYRRLVNLHQRLNDRILLKLRKRQNDRRLV